MRQNLLMQVSCLALICMSVWYGMKTIPTSYVDITDIVLLLVIQNVFE